MSDLDDAAVAREIAKGKLEALDMAANATHCICCGSRTTGGLGVSPEEIHSYRERLEKEAGDGW